jgi:hypothetical protein
MTQLDDQSPPKRRKVSAGIVSSTSDDGTGITSHIQLRDFLVFKQSNQIEAKNGMHKYPILQCEDLLSAKME